MYFEKKNDQYAETRVFAAVLLWWWRDELIRVSLRARHLYVVGAVTGAWPDGGMVTAGIGALVIDGAEPGLRVQIQAIVIGALAECKNFMPMAEVRDDTGFFQPSGDVLGGFFAFEIVGQSHADQVTDAHFHGQGAAAGHTNTAKPVTVFDPGIEPVDIGSGLGSGKRNFLHRALSAKPFKKTVTQDVPAGAEDRALSP